MKKYSVVIPVFNASKTIERVVERTAAFFEKNRFGYEIILVNDGSRDDSWVVLSRLSQKYPAVVAIDLVKNYGQHNANLCGFQHATGDYVITLDDDLQNPPEEIGKLIAKAEEGHDLVIGKFSVKQHGLYRKWGSRWVGSLNRKIFKIPPGLVMSNFRIIHRSIVDHVIDFKGKNPYIPALVVSYSCRPANVEVAHCPREAGESNYTLRRLLKLVFTILFNYSSYPLRVLVAIGGVIALLSFSFGFLLICKALFFRVQVAGWTSIMVLLSFFSGFIILLLGVLGEYLIHVVENINQPRSYFIREVSRRGT